MKMYILESNWDYTYKIVFAVSEEEALSKVEQTIYMVHRVYELTQVVTLQTRILDDNDCEAAIVFEGSL